MKYKILTFLLLFSIISKKQENLNVISRPESIELMVGHFVLNKETVIVTDKVSFEALFLKKKVSKKLV